MARTNATPTVGTVVEVRKKGDATWEKFLCNEGVLAIDHGEKALVECTPIETGVKEKSQGVQTFGSEEFEYKWTQALTNAADTIVKAAYDSGDEIEVRTTMANATSEAVGTTFITPYIVTKYKHEGAADNVWTTKTTFEQNGAPVETPAA